MIQHLLENERLSYDKQSVGLSSAMLSDVRPEVGSSTVSYTLNANIISQIFAESPVVLRAYKDNVPDQVYHRHTHYDCQTFLIVLVFVKLSETEFWTKYFRSQYFRAQEGDNAKVNEKDDIFSRYERKEDRANHGKSYQRTDGRKVDLPIHRLMDLSIDERDEYSSSVRQKDLPGGQVFAPSAKQREKQRLLDKFNRHSHTVLQSSQASLEKVDYEKMQQDVAESIRLPDLEEEVHEELRTLDIEVILLYSALICLQ